MYDIEQIEQTICNIMDVEREKMLSKNHLKRPSIARGYLWLYLHDTIGYSYRQIANLYGRNIRNVRRHIESTKFNIGMFEDSEIEYKGIKIAVDRNVPTAM